MIGSRLGPYEIVEPLGAGGMGEVYRARDTRIGRVVALKRLPEAWADDAERLRRFEQETRTVGALSHPNLLTLYDVGTADGSPYLVTELLQGESLRERLRGGLLPARKAVEIACQIARGLAAAHERGIVHRDLKPENVFLTRDGRVKILDFGLARFGAADASTPGQSQETQLLTNAGAVVGTAGYLSPEQARGLAVDHRSDIFALGVVLYEMLSGLRAFGGTTVVDSISAVVRDDPPPLTGAGVSPALDRVVRRCLEKEAGERYQSAHDVALALEAVSSDSRDSVAAAVPAGSPRRRLGLLLAGVALLSAAIGGLAGYMASPRQQDATAVLRYEGYSGHDASPAVSPDGRLLAFQSSRDGTSRIWLKHVAGSSEAALTAGPDTFPRFHPDGASVLFIRREGTLNALYRQPILGGQARRLISDAEEADWSPDGTRLVFLRLDRDEPTGRSMVLLADADGGNVRQLAHLESLFTRPRWSPDGRQVAFAEYGVQSGAARRVALVAVADGSVRMLETPLRTRRLSSPAWLAGSRHVVFAQAESVTADTTGSSARIYRQDIAGGATQMLLWSPVTAQVLDVLADGSLVWDGTSARANLRLIPVDRDASGGRWVTRGQSIDRQPVYTPDGDWVVFTSNRSGNLDLWALSPRSGAIRRITDDPADDWDPGVTPAGKLVWSSTRSGNFEIWTANLDGSEARQVSQDGLDAENPTATSDGWIVYNSSNPSKRGIWKIRPDGTQATRLSATSVLVPDVSPDGRYVSATFQALSSEVRIMVWRLDDGSKVPFEITLAGEQDAFAVGRTRWTPNGRLAFIGLNDAGVRGVYVQDFEPGRDTTSTRRAVGGFDAETRVDSFAFSPDGSVLALSSSEYLETILRADGVAGITRPAPQP